MYGLDLYHVLTPMSISDQSGFVNTLGHHLGKLEPDTLPHLDSMLLYQCHLRLLNDTYLWLFDTTVLRLVRVARIEEAHTNDSDDFNDFHRFTGKKCGH